MVTRACLRYAREGQNVTQAGPKCHTSRAKMSHKGQNVTQSCYNSPLSTFTKKSEHTLPQDILAQGRWDYRLQLAVNFSSVFAFFSHWDVHVMTIMMSRPRAIIQACSTPICMVQCTHLITTGGTPHLYNRGSSMLVNSLHSGENNM